MVSQPATNPEGQPPTQSAATAWIAVITDLIALAMILSTFVAIVVVGSASAAVISAVGSAIALAFHAWRKRTKATR